MVVVLVNTPNANQGDHDHAVIEGFSRSLGHETIATIENGFLPPTVLGIAFLATMAFRGGNIQLVAHDLQKRIKSNPDDAAALMDLATIYTLLANGDASKTCQYNALAKHLIYRDYSETASKDGVRILAFAAPGDLMSNIPIQFLLENSDIWLDVLYVVPCMDLPTNIPAHDVAMVIVGESDENREILERIAAFASRWPCSTVLNDPRKVLKLSRDGVSALLAGTPSICIPATVRLEPEMLARLGRGEVALGDLLSDGTFPLIVRPLDSHAGNGLAKLDDHAAIGSYLTGEPTGGPVGDYYLSSFSDYHSTDGMFRKYRIAFVRGHPYICHMAVSSRWMVHYLNADMWESAERRDEEARAFASFDDDFAQRHADAFRAIVERIGLDYFSIDCAEATDGRLLVFEADTAMIVHAMDPPDVFPYKQPQMLRIFRAFQDMLRQASGKTA